MKTIVFYFGHNNLNNKKNNIENSIRRTIILNLNGKIRVIIIWYIINIDIKR